MIAQYRQTPKCFVAKSPRGAVVYLLFYKVTNHPANPPLTTASLCRVSKQTTRESVLVVLINLCLRLPATSSELAALPFTPDELERCGQDALSLRSGLRTRLKPPRTGVSKSPFPNRQEPAAKGIPRLSSSGASLSAPVVPKHNDLLKA